MSNPRRNILIRSVATVLGDVTAGVAVAASCAWLIEAATLGLFLSFLVWLIGAVIALAMSQYVVHPAVSLILSDRKLDVGIEVMTDLVDKVTLVGPQLAQQLWNRFVPNTRQ